MHPSYKLHQVLKPKTAKENARYRCNRARTMKDVLTQFSITDDGALINENSRQEKAAYVTSLKLYTGDYISKKYLHKAKG